MKSGKRKGELRVRRHARIRKRVIGTAERPRLCVFRSDKHIYAQVIDDYAGRTLTSAATLSKELRDRIGNGGTVEASTLVGDLIGRKCAEMGISRVVFDRGGFRFQGRVKALAEAVRKRFAEAGAEGF
jgi:large subunit ribosomal protein L18